MSSKAFPRADGGAPFEAVRDLSFSIGRGELVAILGKTGCGKSTTFNLISGLLRPSHGRVVVQGHDPYADFAWFRGKIGIVFQNDRLMPWRTAIENVALGLELNKMPQAQRARDRRDHGSARLGLSGHEHDYPHALSGGMRQRVSIARAFAGKPDILLCDEPFSALDEHTGNALREEFRELLRQTGATCDFHHPFDRRGAAARRAAHGVRAAGAHRLRGDASRRHERSRTRGRARPYPARSRIRYILWRSIRKVRPP